jgi:hypothetical protein
MDFFIHQTEVKNMAKLTGPLFSLDASGKYGGAIVFSKWKGRNYARQLVTPANPQSADQETARNAVRVAGQAQKWVNANTQINGDLTLADLAEIKAITPAGYAWNGELTKAIIGAGAVNIAASDALWAAFTTEKGDWDTAADGLTAPMLAVAQFDAGGAAGTPKTSGNVFFNYIYGLYVMGLVAVPDGTPPTYT